MQDSEKANLCSQVRGICGDRSQGVCSGAEHNVKDLRFVLVSDCGDFVGNGENDVEVFGIEEVSFTVLEPLCACERLTFRTAPRPAGIVDNALVTAVIALLDTTAECRGATKFNCGHGATLCC